MTRRDPMRRKGGFDLQTALGRAMRWALGAWTGLAIVALAPLAAAQSTSLPAAAQAAAQAGATQADAGVHACRAGSKKDASARFCPPGARQVVDEAGDCLCLTTPAQAACGCPVGGDETYVFRDGRFVAVCRAPDGAETAVLYDGAIRDGVCDCDTGDLPLQIGAGEFACRPYPARRCIEGGVIDGLGADLVDASDGDPHYCVCPEGSEPALRAEGVVGCEPLRSAG